MIFVIPISIGLTFEKISTALDYIGVNSGQSIGVKIDNFLRYCCQTNSYLTPILFADKPYGEIRIRQLSVEVIIAIIFIIIIIFLFHICEKKYSLMKGNKIFSSKGSENMVVVLTSMGIGSFVNIMVIRRFINILRMRTGQSMALYGMDLIKAVSVDILSIGIVGFIAYKIIKKILKNIV